jgi:hypothetical protein
MNMINNNTQENNPRPVPDHARAISSNDEHTPFQRLPAGGWVREVSCRENWRTTTIVHRHRDEAAPASYL